ncbi:hypothetical protein WJX77_004847 [Trebouxia sp. C0004]
MMKLVPEVLGKTHAFLIALILGNEGHATAIPPDWWTVKRKSPAKRKSPEVSPSPEVHPQDADIDLDDPEILPDD